MADRLSRAWAVLSRPSNDPRPNPLWYRWATNQLGHALVGACAAAALALVAPWALPGWAVVAVVAAFYAAAKEVPDTLLRGGDWRDGAADTLFVGLGAAYAGPVWWPWVVMAVVVGGVALKMRGAAWIR